MVSQDKRVTLIQNNIIKNNITLLKEKKKNNITIFIMYIML